MDLMNLMAKLTLSSSEYEKALKQAESKAKSFKGDVTGSIEGEDNYSSIVREAQREADRFDGDVEGKLTGHDKYTSEEKKAQKAAKEFDGDEEGTLTGIDEYSDDVTAAQTSADGFDGDEEGTLTGTDDYSGVVDDAQTAADGFDGDASGTLSGTDDYSDDVSSAQAAADSFDGDATGTLTGVDDYSDDVTAAQKSADSFKGDKDGTLSGTDSYSSVVDSAQEKADSFDGDAEATLSAVDNASATISSAQTSADGFEDTYDATLSATDSTTSGITSAKKAGDDFDGTVFSATLSATDNTSVGVSSAETEVNAFDGETASATLSADDNTSTGITSAETAGQTFDNESFEADLGVDTTDFDAGLSDAETKGNTFASGIEGIVSKIEKALTAAAIVGGIQKIGQAFVDVTMNAAAYADAVDKGSRALSMSTESYQVWNYVLGQNGASIDDLSRGWLNLTDAIDMAKNHQDEWINDSGDVKNALKALNINPKDFNSVDEMLDSVFKKLAEMGKGTDRDTIVTALFGKGGTKLNAMLDSGVESIEELKGKAYELGLVLSDEKVTNGVAFGDAVSDMNQAVEALKNNILTGLMPVLTEAVEAVTSIISWLTGAYTGNDTLAGQFENIDREMNKQLVTADKDQRQVKGLIDYMNSLSLSGKDAATNMKLWNTSAEKLIELCPSLKKYINLTTQEFTAEAKEIEKATDAYFNNIRIKAMESASGKKLQALMEAEDKAADKRVDIEMMKQDIAWAYQNGALANRKEINKKAPAVAKMFKGLSDDISTWTIEDYQKAQEGLLAMSSYGNSTYSILNRSGVLDTVKGWKHLEGNDDIGELVTDLEDLEKQVDNATQAYERSKKVVTSYLESLGAGLEKIPTEVKTTITVETVEEKETNGKQNKLTHAKGLNYVPYDNYEATLHRGEMVLNQGQARYYESNAIDVDAIASAVASAVSSSLVGMSVTMDGREVGNVVTPQVSKNIAAQMRSGRYT